MLYPVHDENIGLINTPQPLSYLFLSHLSPSIFFLPISPSFSPSLSYLPVSLPLISPPCLSISLFSPLPLLSSPLSLSPSLLYLSPSTFLPLFAYLVSWSCKIHRLLLCRGVRFTQRESWI